MASAEADWQGFSQVFYEQLKCYICESHLNAREDRWYQCQAFHWICHGCKTVKGRCSCGSSFGTNYCQLIKAALSVDTMRFKCENLSRGCKETSDKEGMIVHQTECIFSTCQMSLDSLQILADGSQIERSYGKLFRYQANQRILWTKN